MFIAIPSTYEVSQVIGSSIMREIDDFRDWAQFVGAAR